MLNYKARKVQFALSQFLFLLLSPTLMAIAPPPSNGSPLVAPRAEVELTGRTQTTAMLHLPVLLLEDANVNLQAAEGQTLRELIEEIGMESLRGHFNETDLDTLLINGETLLHEAARLGLTNLIKILIRHGANLRAANNLGEYPFNIALQNGHIDILDDLSAERGSMQL